MPTQPPELEEQRIPPRPSPDEAGTDARERILRTAYELFSDNGLTAVGVDRIVAEARVAKTTLYRHFRSKDDLVVAVLERHEEIWTRGWLEREVERRAETPAARFLAIFDALDIWFWQDSYEGCLFTNSLLENHDRSSQVRAASLAGFESIYAFLLRLAKEARVRDPDAFAHQIQILMRGAVVAAVQDSHEAVQQARVLAERLVAQEGGEAGSL